MRQLKQDLTDKQVTELCFVLSRNMQEKHRMFFFAKGNLEPLLYWKENRNLIDFVLATINFLKDKNTT